MIIIATVVSCYSNPKIVEQIRHAEQIAQEHPDSALSIMRGVDRSMLRGKSVNAHYLLVLSEAMYYNRTTPDRDTIAKPLFNYYHTSKNHAERARAMYQHALVMQSQGENARAMYSLLEAEKSLAKVDHPRLKGLVHRTKGEIYGSECLYANAYDEHAKAKQEFERANLQTHATYATLDIGRVALTMRNYAAAEASFVQVCGIAERNGEQLLLCETLYLLADLYTEMDNYIACRTMLRRIAEGEMVKHDRAHYHLLDATTLAYEGHRTEATAALRLAAEAEDCDNDALNYASYITYRTLGIDKLALQYHELCKHTQDSLMLEVLEHPLLNTQIELLDNRLRSKALEEHMARNRMVALCILFVTALALIILYIRYRLRLKSAEIMRYSAIIEDMQTAIDSNNSTTSSTISGMYRDRFAELNALLDTYYDHDGSSRQKNIIYEQMCDIVKELKHSKRRNLEIETAVNRYRNNLMQRLREQIPDLRPRELSIALYSYAGFSNRAISIFIDSDPVTVSKLRYGLKQKIKSSGAKDAEALAAALSD